MDSARFAPDRSPSSDLPVKVRLALNGSCRRNCHAGAVSRHEGRLFDATRGLLPGISSLSGFMDYCSLAIDRIGEALGQAAENVRKGDEAGGYIVHAGTWPGGHDMAFFMDKLLKASTAMDVPKTVVDWCKDNIDGLALATGEAPPIRKKSLLGADWMRKDEVDKAALKDYFFAYRIEIKQYLYGDCVLDL